MKTLCLPGGARQDDLDRWTDQVTEDQAAVKQAEANLKKAQLAQAAQIDGVNTGIVQAKAQLAEAQYFLDNTTIYAPENGMIVSQQARPGLVVGDIRLGAIASFVTEDSPYILATYRQQNLKFVEPGQPVEVALDLYPGEILTGKVEAIWWATRQGQYLPSGRLPGFELPELPGRIAVQISVDVPEGHTFPAGGGTRPWPSIPGKAKASSFCAASTFASTPSPTSSDRWISEHDTHEPGPSA